ncbi:F-box protein [Raphanus sativus]|nr:F-box protein [Raphanus sativus]
MIGEFKCDFFILSLPEDITVLIFRLLSPSDICNLSCCCRSLCDIVNSENVWLDQCENVKVIPPSDIVQWRTGVSSYKSLCRFLVEVMKPLFGVWVYHQPELGNVVYVMPGFLSVVGCRIIPQEVGPLGIQEGRIMWSPVFEIVCDLDGGSTKFFSSWKRQKRQLLVPWFGYRNREKLHCAVTGG